MVKKILIIEADPTALRLTEYTLKQRGHQVLTTCNGLEGILTAQKESPDLIILDIMLPGIDGYEVCKRLRAGAQTAGIPILIISGKAREEDIAIGLRAGASDYLPKPATPSSIISHAERLLTSRPDSLTGIIAFINSSGLPGMTVLLAELAASLADMDKQVTLVEVSGEKPRKNTAPPENGRAIMETSGDKTGQACEVLPSGIKVLHISEAAGDNGTDSIEVVRGMSGATDYMLIELALKPSPFTKAALAACEMTVIACGHKLNDMSGISEVIRLLGFSGVPPEKIAAILVDPEGIFPPAALSSLKPYFETTFGVDLAGVISFDAKVYQLSYLESQPLVRSSQSSPFAQSVRQIARYLLSHQGLKKEPLPSFTKAPRLERGK